MTDLYRLIDLALLKALDVITPKQEKELQKLVKAFKEDSLLKALEEERLITERIDPIDLHNRLKALRGIDSSRLDKPSKRRRSFLPWGIAAAIMVLGCWLVYRSATTETTPLYPVEATLHWADGSVNLGEMEEGQSYEASAIQIARMHNEFFIRETDKAAVTNYQLNVGGNEDIQVFFSDSIRTQLHPKSSLSFAIYPPGAPLKEKRLSCDGQVLIDAPHHCQIPLVIKTPRQEIAVLGTTFEIHDYPGEDTSAVFCYSGKIKVNAGNDTQILKTAQRSTTQPGHRIKISEGDFPQVHWSSPELMFDFSNDDLDSAMNEIARWYGFSQVAYQQGMKINIPGMVYTGKLSRYLPLSRLLSILERSDLHFSIQGRTIVVSEK